MKKICLIVCFFLSAFFCAKAQSNYTDSLRAELSKSKEDTNKVFALLSLADTYVWSFPDSSILYAQQALRLAKKLNFKEGKLGAYSVLAEAFSGRGNYAQALQAALHNLEMSEEGKDSSHILWSYANIGSVYFYAGEYAKALSYYNKTKLNRKTFHQNQLLFTGFLGETYFHLNRLDSAWYYLQISYKLDQKRKYKWPVPYIYIGNIYTLKRQYDSALNYYHQAVGFSMAKLDLTHEYYAIANVYQKLSQKDSAIFYARKALAVAQNSSYVSEVAKAGEMLTQLYLKNSNYDSTAIYMHLMLAAKDSLYRQAQQNLFVNEQLFTQEAQQKESAYKSKIRIYIFIGGLIILLLFLGILYRNNRRKLKSNLILKKTLSDLKSTQKQLIQSEKMASLGELTAGIAHEIQNPLNFVNNFSEVNTELLAEMNTEIDKGNLNEVKVIAHDITENSERIIHHGKRADAIVKGMLQHSRISSGKKEPTNINALADEYFRLSYHGMRAKDKSFNATMKTDFDESVGKINVVPQDIGRVMLNLFNNAFYAVAEKKKQQPENYEPTVWVSTKRIADGIPPSGGTRGAGAFIEIRVKDNGNGIPEKIKDKIFQPFFTTKPTGEGTGLGLSLSYDMIKAHDGEIKVNSEDGIARPDDPRLNDSVGQAVGRGTEFVVTLPA